MALAALQTGVLVVDADGILTRVNPAAARMIGRPAATLTGQPLEQAGLPALLAGWLATCLRQGHDLSVAEADLGPACPAADVHIQCLSQGLLVELAAVAERVRQRELRERADRQQTLARLLRSLAHELRNPLGGIRGAAQLIEQQSDDPALTRHARLISREADRVTRLIEVFARGDEGEPEPVNVHRALDEAAELVLAECGYRVQVSRDYDPSIPDLNARPTALHQLFLNLLRNAAQANAGRLRLITRVEHASELMDEPGRHALRVDIEDDGDGVPEHLRPRLFLPLVTGRETGNGFGLAIVQQIARRHGGLVEYQPLPTGSRFRVRLPLVTDAHGAAA